ARLDKAELLVSRWLAHNPNDCDALLLRGQVAFQAHRWTDAGRDLAASINSGPDQFFIDVARKLLASAYLELGNFEGALALFRECRKTDPQDTEVLYNLGQSATYLQRWDEALEAFKEGLRLRPDRDFLLRAAHVHEMRQGFSAALALLQKAETGDPKDLEVLSSMARVLQAMGKTEDARAYRKRYDGLKEYWTEARARSPGK